MKKTVYLLLALMWALLVLVSPAFAEDALSPSGLAPFLCFDWVQAAQDPDMCREMQPTHDQIVREDGMILPYRLVLGNMQEDLVEGSIFPESGSVLETEMLWNALVQSLTECSDSCSSDGFAGKDCRIILCFTAPETMTQLMLMNYPSGLSIAFRCQPGSK